VGNKSGRTRKHVLFNIAASFLIIAFSTVACAPIQDKIAEIRAHQQLEEYREKLAAGFFETIIEKSNEVLAKSETEPPADVAFYSLGEVYANHDFAGRDYSRAKYYFEKLIENFPDSELTTEASTYISLFETITEEQEKLSAKEKEAAEAERESQEKIKQVVQQQEKAPKANLPHKVVENQNFEEAVKKNLQILEKSGKNKPSDEALYNLGLIYAHVDNPAKDYNKSQIYFHVLVKQFPDSEYTEEARIWLGLYDTLEKIQQIDLEIEQQKKQLTR